MARANPQIGAHQGNMKNPATNVTMNASVAGAIAKLLNATDALEDVAKNLAKTTKKVDRGA